MMERQKKHAELKHTEFSSIYLCKSVCAQMRYACQRDYALPI